MARNKIKTMLKLQILSVITLYAVSFTTEGQDKIILKRADKAISTKDSAGWDLTQLEGTVWLKSGAINLYSDKADVFKRGKYILLTGDVKIDDDQSITIATQNAKYYPTDNRLELTENFRCNSPEWTLRSAGATYDFKTHTFNLPEGATLEGPKGENPVIINGNTDIGSKNHRPSRDP